MGGEEGKGHPLAAGSRKAGARSVTDSRDSAEVEVPASYCPWRAVPMDFVKKKKNQKKKKGSSG